MGFVFLSLRRVDYREVRHRHTRELKLRIEIFIAPIRSINLRIDRCLCIFILTESKKSDTEVNNNIVQKICFARTPIG